MCRNYYLYWEVFRLLQTSTTNCPSSNTSLTLKTSNLKLRKITFISSPIERVSSRDLERHTSRMVLLLKETLEKESLRVNAQSISIVEEFNNKWCL